MRRECRELFPHPRFQRIVPWCMSGSLTRCGWDNVPGIPGACATRNFTKLTRGLCTVYPKKYAHGFCFAVLCCSYTLTDFPISIMLTSLALWQSKDCPSASKATLVNMDKYFMWIHYERLHNHNKAKHNKTVCLFLGIYCITMQWICQACGCSPGPFYVGNFRHFSASLPPGYIHQWRTQLRLAIL